MWELREWSASSSCTGPKCATPYPQHHGSSAGLSHAHTTTGQTGKQIASQSPIHLVLLPPHHANQSGHALHEHRTLVGLMTFAIFRERAQMASRGWCPNTHRYTESGVTCTISALCSVPHSKPNHYVPKCKFQLYPTILFKRSLCSGTTVYWHCDLFFGAALPRKKQKNAKRVSTLQRTELQQLYSKEMPLQTGVCAPWGCELC